jgi:hypothetical protein
MSCGIATEFVERGQRDTGAENRHRAPDSATRARLVKEEQG